MTDREYKVMVLVLHKEYFNNWEKILDECKRIKQNMKEVNNARFKGGRRKSKKRTKRTKRTNRGRKSRKLRR